MTIFKANSNTR